MDAIKRQKTVAPITEVYGKIPNFAPYTVSYQCRCGWAAERVPMNNCDYFMRHKNCLATSMNYPSAGSSEFKAVRLSCGSDP